MIGNPHQLILLICTKQNIFSSIFNLVLAYFLFLKMLKDYELDYKSDELQNDGEVMLFSKLNSTN